MVNALMENIQMNFFGPPTVITKVILTLLARGHLLIEDVPGVGKTTLAKNLAKSVQCSFSRIQFTPDLLPSDITGISIYNKKTNQFEFNKGPIFHNVILADEINRASPKTQSALLESMSERQVTIDGTTYSLQEPFIVLATQNPIEFEGTFPLPEAQMDRFMMKITIGYPTKDDELKIIENYEERMIPTPFEQHKILEMQQAVQEVYCQPQLKNYLIDIIQTIRASAKIELGPSPRASKDLLMIAKANAFIKGRTYVVPDDITDNIIEVLSHRVLLTSEVMYKKQSVEDIINQLAKTVTVPKISK